MGSFYVNHIVKSESGAGVLKALAGRSAFIAKAGDGCVMVFDEESDSQNAEVMFNLGAELSGQLECPVLAVLNHDDDILAYGLFENGELTDQYNSAPDYFDPDGELADPQGGDAKRLAKAFGSQNADRVGEILRKSSYGEDGYTFATDRHADLARALGLPEVWINLGFNYLAQGALPSGLSQVELTRVE